jgi:DNA-binding GntR family transcriptional regulator
MPEYQRIAHDLKQRIQTGELGAGALLPTIKQLQERYGATAQAVKSALLVLWTEGLVQAGTVVTPVRSATPRPARRHHRPRGRYGRPSARPRTRRYE